MLRDDQKMTEEAHATHFEGGGHGEESFDVAICGGGLAGLTLALQLHQQMPQISVVLIEKLTGPLPEAAFKVGEATVETGTHYLYEVLGLKEYLTEAHIRKPGLRYFFGDSNAPFQNRPEFGLSQYSKIRSYQLDRGILESDLRRILLKTDVRLLEGYTVTEIELGSNAGYHRITYREGNSGKPVSLRARWVVDAMGRRRYLQKKLRLTVDSSKKCSAAWFRVKGKIDVCNLVPQKEKGWHTRVPGDLRYRSTTHLMGDGYWVWLIPLSSEATSIGIVTLEEVHPFSDYNTYPKALQWIGSFEPGLGSLLQGLDPMDFKVMRRYSFSSKKVYSADRWACVGDSAVFSDPFYALANDLVAFGNCFVTEMIKLDFEGKLTPEIVDKGNRFLISVNHWLTRNIQLGYPFFGNATVMAAKLIWDFAAGWSHWGPQMFNAIFLDDETEASFRKESARFFTLTLTMQRLFVQWSDRSSGRLTFKFIDYLSIPILSRIQLRNLRPLESPSDIVMNQKENMRDLEELAQALFLLAVEDVMPDQMVRFKPPVWLDAWGLSLQPEDWNGRILRPSSEPRDLSSMRSQIRNQFHPEPNHDGEADHG